jgi:hypothetical protein
MRLEGLQFGGDSIFGVLCPTVAMVFYQSPPIPCLTTYATSPYMHTAYFIAYAPHRSVPLMLSQGDNVEAVLRQ